MSDRKPIHLDDSSIFWGAIIGFIMGAIVWLFHVPKRGEATRKDIIDTSKAIIGQKREEDTTQEDNVPTQPNKYFR